MSSIAKRFGKRLRSLRRKKGFTQERLAEAAGLSGKHIGEIERGEVNLTIQALEQIAKAVGLEVHEALRCDHEEDPEMLCKELIVYITQCPEAEVKLAYKLMTVLR